MRMIAAVAVWLTCLGPGIALAQKFRVETDVFIGEAAQPQMQYLTLFNDNFVYDLPLNEPHRATLFDVAHFRIVLLDSERRMQYRLDTNELLRYIAGMKAELLKPNVDRDFLKLADPPFVHQFNEADSTLTLASERINYKVVGLQPKQPIAAQQYRDFADWSARLNATYPNGAPPFARLQLNAALVEKGLIPESIERTVLDKNRRNPSVVRTRHLSNWILSNTDQQRIVEWETNLTGFRSVTREEFFQQPLVENQ